MDVQAIGCAGHQRGVTGRYSVLARKIKKYLFMLFKVLYKIAENKERMRKLMAKLQRYVEEKSLEINKSKTIIMKCRKGGGKRKKIRWKGKVSQTVREMKSRIRDHAEWKAGRTDKGQSEKGNNNSQTSVGNKKANVEGRLGKETVDL